MSDPRPTDPAADEGALRFHLGEGRLRVNDADLTIDVPLAIVEQWTGTADQGCFNLRMSINIRVSDVVIHHRADSTDFEAVPQAWLVARVPDVATPESAETAARPEPEPEPPAPIEAPSSISGPPLIADGPDWLMFAPLLDTRLLACGELLASEESR